MKKKKHLTSKTYSLHHSILFKHLGNFNPERSVMFVQAEYYFLFTFHVFVYEHWFFFLSLPSGDFKCPVKEEVTVTSGEWEVLANHGAKVKVLPTFRCLQLMDSE